MKKVRRSFAIALLLLALTTAALADDGQMGVPLTNPTPQGQTDAPAEGQMDTPLVTSSTTGGDAGQTDIPLTDVALALLQSLPTLF
ncbi:MAG: hypothetical protein DMF67_14670 [Acidobacteria bacterium]|nr:MAG: hypothetical protein DMF66_00430 [Acidobacteriota bacterium]PYS81953.1 MAG: hypothetical protein DMF67_14670 [Acidobacteriota bacterium]